LLVSRPDGKPRWGRLPTNPRRSGGPHSAGRVIVPRREICAIASGIRGYGGEIVEGTVTRRCAGVDVASVEL
jgi:hypothetical protein